jgi:hypothetical protein
MSKETCKRIFHEAYENYASSYTQTLDNFTSKRLLEDNPNWKPHLLPKEGFIAKVRADEEFAKKWGLKIEERELSLEERKQIVKNKYFQEFYWKIVDDDNDVVTIFEMDKRNIPTKLITITYNDKTIESYG